MSTVIDGRYEVLEVVGTGTTTRTYRALDRQRNEHVAMKEIHISSTTAEMLSLPLDICPRVMALLHRISIQLLPIPLQAEIINQSSITSDYTVPLLDVKLQDENAYIVMPLMSGNVLDLLRNELSCGGAIRDEISFKIMYSLVHAVYDMHKSDVCHLDIKLENILYNTKGDVRLCDFGLSVQSNSDTELTCYRGTHYYAAPEILLQLPYDGKRADLWSLGVCIYALYTGTLPFLGARDTVCEHVVMCKYNIPSWVPRDVQVIIASLLKYTPSARRSLADILNSEFWRSQCMRYSLHHTFVDDEYPQTCTLLAGLSDTEEAEFIAAARVKRCLTASTIQFPKEKVAKETAPKFLNKFFSKIQSRIPVKSNRRVVDIVH